MLNMQNKLSYNILLLVLVSICIIFLQQGEINRDGIMYLSQSQYIVEGNWDKAMKTYNWPFFSILIAGLHQLTGLSLENSKHPKRSWMKWGLVSLLMIYFLNVIIDKPEPHYEQQAGQWVKDQHLDLNNVYFNHNRVAYYSGLLAFDRTDLKTATEVIQYPYLMMRYDRFTEVKEISGYQPIEYFPSIDNPKVIVYTRIAND